MSRGRGRRATDHRIHDVVLWNENVWVEGVEETQWIVYDSRVDRLYRFNEQQAALSALQQLKLQDPNLNQV